MKLKCKHQRRVMVLPSGNSIHREDGSACRAPLIIGDKSVKKVYTLYNKLGAPEVSLERSEVNQQ